MTRRGLLLFATMSVLWGIPYLFIRIAVLEISPATLVFARTALGAALLVPAALLTTDVRPAIRRWRWVAAFAIVEISIPWLTLAAAEQEVSSSMAALLLAGVPLVGSLIALATGSVHRLSGTAIVGLLVGLAGVAAIAGGDIEASGFGPLLLIGITVVGYAVGPVILSGPLVGVASLPVMAGSLAFNTVLYAVISFATGWPAAFPSSQVVASIAVLGVFCTAAAFLVFAELVKEIGPVRATVITYVNPAVAALLGVAVLHEAFTVSMLAGFALVTAGSVLATRRRRGEPPAPTPIEPS